MARRTDHHLLEFAAIAAGIGPVLCYEKRRNCLRIGDRESYSLWRPLTHAGDAMALQEKLQLAVMPSLPDRWVAFRPFAKTHEFSEKTPLRAIVLAAAIEGENTDMRPTKMCQILARVHPG